MTDLETFVAGDTFSFDIAGAPLTEALKIASLSHKKVEAWKVDVNKETQKPRLILFWVFDANNPTLKEFIAPVETNSNTLAELVKSWLNTADYGKEPGTDGSIEKSSRVYNEQWGHVDNNWRAFVAIEPHWAVYSK